MNVGEDTTLGDGNVSQKLVQLLIVPNGELKVTGDDTGLLVVTGSVTGQLEDFGSEVLEDGSEVDGSTGTDTLSVVALSQKTVDTTNGESETRLGRTAEIESDLVCPSDGSKRVNRVNRLHLRLGVLGARGLATRFAAASHFEISCMW